MWSALAEVGVEVLGIREGGVYIVFVTDGKDSHQIGILAVNYPKEIISVVSPPFRMAPPTVHPHVLYKRQR
jgi:hypothetical protein